MVFIDKIFPPVFLKLKLLTKWLLIVCFILPVSPIAVSQDVEWSYPQKFDRKFPNVSVFGDDAAGFYMYKSGEKLTQIKIEHYGNRMKLVNESHIKLKNKDAEIRYVYFLNGTILVFYTVPRVQSGILEFYVQKFTKAGTMMGKAMKIDEKVYETSDERFPEESFRLVLSKDQEELMVFHKCPQLICYRNESEKQEKNTTFYFKVFDSDLKYKWEEELAVPYPYKKLIVERLMMDGDKVFVLAVQSDDDKLKKLPGMIRNIVFVYDHSTKDFKNYELNVRNLFITDLNFALNKKSNNLIISGFYSSEKTFNAIGTIYTTIDLNRNAIARKQFSPFNRQFIEHIAMERPEDEEAFDMENVKFNVDKIIPKDDGGIVLIAEGIADRESAYYNAATQTLTKTFTFEYNNIVVASINEQGKLIWEQTITKRQISENDNGFYSSYKVINYNKKLHIVFNEAIQRESDVLQYYTIDMDDGEMYAWLLFNAREDALIIPKSGLAISDHELIIPTLRKGKFSFVKMTF